MDTEEKSEPLAPHDEMPEGEEPPPRGAKLMATIRWILLAVAALVAVTMWLSFARAHFHAGNGGAAAAAHTKYHCPMHPQIVADEPGECPICHMNLEPIAVDEDAGMVTMRSTDSSVAAASAPPGTAPITLTLDRVQAIGVRTGVATERTASRPIRVTAVIAPTDQGVAEVHVRAPGFVESIAASQTGVAVRAGQPLLGVYSPEIFQAESELVATARWTSPDGGSTRAPDAARHKLELLGMADADIQRVLEKGEPMRAIPIYAPLGGFIAKKNVVLGSYVTPEMALYEIQDLSRVYVIAEVFEQDIGAIRVGTEGRFTPTKNPDAALVSHVDLVYPTLDAAARTTRVRMQVRNDKGALRPGEYGSVEFALGARKVVTVPRDAVIDMGETTYVFLVEGEGRFTPRTVTLGESSGDDVVVVRGLLPGDRVVSGATFMIDSESRLQASAQSSAVAPASPSAGSGGTSDDGPSCDADFDRAKFPDKWTDCKKCVQVHHGMGSMEADCKNAIVKPWR